MTASTVCSGADKGRHRLSYQVVAVQIDERHRRSGKGAEIESASAEVPQRSGQPRFVGVEKIRSELLANKSWPTRILIERLNDIIPKPPCIVPPDVMLVTI